MKGQKVQKKTTPVSCLSVNTLQMERDREKGGLSDFIGFIYKYINWQKYIH